MCFLHTHLSRPPDAPSLPQGDATVRVPVSARAEPSPRVTENSTHPGPLLCHSLCDSPPTSGAVADDSAPRLWDKPWREGVVHASALVHTRIRRASRAGPASHAARGAHRSAGERVCDSSGESTRSGFAGAPSPPRPGGRQGRPSVFRSSFTPHSRGPGRGAFSCAYRGPSLESPSHVPTRFLR